MDRLTSWKEKKQKEKLSAANNSTTYPSPTWKEKKQEENLLDPVNLSDTNSSIPSPSLIPSPTPLPPKPVWQDFPPKEGVSWISWRYKPREDKKPYLTGSRY